MTKRDARKLRPKAQEEIRRLCVRWILDGATHGEAAARAGVSRPNVTLWWGLYQQGGWDALKPKARGRRKGAQMRLTVVQQKKVCRMITDKTPDQLKLPFALWTRGAVAELIERHYRLSLPVRTMGDYLSRWGFSPQKPLKRAYEQQPELVTKWLHEQYPAIVRQACQERAEIYWADETGLTSADARGRGYAPRGCTPVVVHPGQRFTASMISAITNRGALRFMVYDGGLKVATFIQFLRRLIRDVPRKVFLILDNLQVHRARSVARWVERHAKKIALFFLPPYSPERNPDEYVNQDVKATMRRRPAPRSRPELKAGLRSYMARLQRQKHKISRFFEHEMVHYAKAA